MKMRRLILVGISLAAALGLSACADAPTGVSANASSNLAAPNPNELQTLRVEVLGSDGRPINGLACRLSNNYGYFLAQSGGSVSVRRSDHDLNVECDVPNGLPTLATLRARPEANSAGSADANQKSAPASTSNTQVFGSVGLGSMGSSGGIGISIGFPLMAGGSATPASDARAATGWFYPAWVQLQVGKTLWFDAQGSVPNQPAIGFERVPRPIGPVGRP